MSATDTLERVAELLPEAQRERFFATIARFRNVPEDDEYLLILEAIGFMTLLWHEVPARITEILAGAKPVSADDPVQAEYVLQQIRTEIKASLDTPSHDDLRLLAHELREQQQLFLRATHASQLGAKPLNPNGPGLGLILLSALTGACLLYGFQQVSVSDLRRNWNQWWNRQSPSQVTGRPEWHRPTEDRVMCQLGHLSKRGTC